MYQSSTPVCSVPFPPGSDRNWCSSSADPVAKSIDKSSWRVSRLHDKDWLITWVLSIDRHRQSRPSCDLWTGISNDYRPAVLFWQQVLKFSQCQSALIMMPTGQLCLDDLRNVRQALVIQHPPCHQADPGLGRLFLERISKIDRKMTYVLQIITWCRRMLVIAGEGFEYSRLKDPPGSSGKKRYRELTALLLIIKAEAVSKELLNSINLTGARVLCISEPSEARITS